MLYFTGSCPRRLEPSLCIKRRRVTVEAACKASVRNSEVTQLNNLIVLSSSSASHVRFIRCLVVDLERIFTRAV